MPQPRISILIPAYNESGNIAPLLGELSATLAGLPDYDFTILFVDDGSTDVSAAFLEQAAAADPRIGVIELSRNFGKEMALTTGLRALECDACIIMDADLQHPPRYSYSRLFRLDLNSFMAISLVPLKLAGYIGFFVIVVFGGLLAFMAYDKFNANHFNFSPIAFVIVSNVIMNGIVLGCIGLVALSIGHIHTEVIGRPLYLVRKRISPRAAAAGDLSLSDTAIARGETSRGLPYCVGPVSRCNAAADIGPLVSDSPLRLTRSPRPVY